MSEIITDEGTITLNHEWPTEVRMEAFTAGQPVVSLEVDTDQGTAVLALSVAELAELSDTANYYVGYYGVLAEDIWNSR